MYKKIIGTELKNKKFLDIGCGEGWSLKYFSDIGCNVKGIDHSSFGIKQFNPELMDHFIKCDIFEFQKNEKLAFSKYDIINVNCVLEHVLDPEKLLTDMKHLLTDRGVFIVTFPNDFSDIQKLSVDLKKNNEYWVVSPDHISYFNKDSFQNMAESLGFKIELLFAEFPIEIFLLNKHSNYVRDKTKGKEAHMARIRTMNLLSKIDFERTLQVFSALGDIGFGRGITAFMTIIR